ncbi:dipeptidyl peptidase 2-like [Sycon ciliatum]|uniref:dipeptidyl peptidase 2-like n=1 Tax=Sycon ciliatum TaxID=27933 RepID=UPI0031F6E654
MATGMWNEWKQQRRQQPQRCAYLSLSYASLLEWLLLLLATSVLASTSSASRTVSLHSKESDSKHAIPGVHADRPQIGAPSLRNIPLLQPQFFEQRVDHYNTSDLRTFNQKFFVYDAYKSKSDGASLLFYCGPETTELSSYTATNLSLAYFAQTLGAVVVSAEHRYFGVSLPFGNRSFAQPYIQYLAIEQTLADYAAIIQHVKDSIPGLGASKVISFGGSYGGHLSMLMRVHHPDIVTGSIASAAATCTFGNIPDSTWYDLVSETYEQTVVSIGDDRIECSREIQYTFDHLWACIFNSSCRGALQSHLRLCTAVGTISDGYILMFYARNLFSIGAQFDYPIAWPPTHVANSLQQHLCIPTAAEDKILLALNLIYNSTGGLACFPFHGPAPLHAAHMHRHSRSAMLKSTLRRQTGPASHSQPHTESPVGIQDQPFQYVCCRDFPQPIGGKGIFSVPSPVNFTRTVENCQKKWGIGPSLEKWRSFVQEPLLSSGSNIAFTNGGYDPVRGFSPDHDLSPSVVVMAAEMGHTYDLFYPSIYDPQSVVSVRDHQLTLIKQWLAGINQRQDLGITAKEFGETIQSLCSHQHSPAITSV